MGVIGIGILIFWIPIGLGTLVFVTGKPLGRAYESYTNKPNSLDIFKLAVNDARGYGTNQSRSRNVQSDLELLSPDSDLLNSNAAIVEVIEFNTTCEIGELASEETEQKGGWTLIIIIGLFVATCLIKGLPVLCLRLIYGPGPKMPKSNTVIKENQTATSFSETNDSSEVTKISGTDNTQEICVQIKSCTKL